MARRKGMSRSGLKRTGSTKIRTPMHGMTGHGRRSGRRTKR